MRSHPISDASNKHPIPLLPNPDEFQLIKPWYRLFFTGFSKYDTSRKELAKLKLAAVAWLEYIEAQRLTLDAPVEKKSDEQKLDKRSLPQSVDYDVVRAAWGKYRFHPYRLRLAFPVENIIESKSLDDKNLSIQGWANVLAGVDLENAEERNQLWQHLNVDKGIFFQRAIQHQQLGFPQPQVNFAAQLNRSKKDARSNQTSETKLRSQQGSPASKKQGSQNLRQVLFPTMLNTMLTTAQYREEFAKNCPGLLASVRDQDFITPSQLSKKTFHWFETGANKFELKTPITNLQQAIAQHLELKPYYAGQYWIQYRDDADCFTVLFTPKQQAHLLSEVNLHDANDRKRFYDSLSRKITGEESLFSIFNKEGIYGHPDSSVGFSKLATTLRKILGNTQWAKEFFSKQEKLARRLKLEDVYLAQIEHPGLTNIIKNSKRNFLDSESLYEFQFRMNQDKDNKKRGNTPRDVLKNKGKWFGETKPGSIEINKLSLIIKNNDGELKRKILAHLQEEKNKDLFATLEDEDLFDLFIKNDPNSIRQQIIMQNLFFRVTRFLTEEKAVSQEIVCARHQQFLNIVVAENKDESLIEIIKFSELYQFDQTPLPFYTKAMVQDEKITIVRDKIFQHLLEAKQYVRLIELASSEEMSALTANIGNQLTQIIGSSGWSDVKPISDAEEKVDQDSLLTKEAQNLKFVGEILKSQLVDKVFVFRDAETLNIKLPLAIFAKLEPASLQNIFSNLCKNYPKIAKSFIRLLFTEIFSVSASNSRLPVSSEHYKIFLNTLFLLDLELVTACLPDDSAIPLSLIAQLEHKTLIHLFKNETWKTAISLHFNNKDMSQWLDLAFADQASDAYQLGKNLAIPENAAHEFIKELICDKRCVSSHHVLTDFAQPIVSWFNGVGQNLISEPADNAPLDSKDRIAGSNQSKKDNDWGPDIEIIGQLIEKNGLKVPSILDAFIAKIRVDSNFLTKLLTLLTPAQQGKLGEYPAILSILNAHQEKIRQQREELESRLRLEEKLSSKDAAVVKANEQQLSDCEAAQLAVREIIGGASIEAKKEISMEDNLIEIIGPIKTSPVAVVSHVGAIVKPENKATRIAFYTQGGSSLSFLSAFPMAVQAWVQDEMVEDNKHKFIAGQDSGQDEDGTRAFEAAKSNFAQMVDCFFADLQSADKEGETSRNLLKLLVNELLDNANSQFYSLNLSPWLLKKAGDWIKLLSLYGEPESGQPDARLNFLNCKNIKDILLTLTPTDIANLNHCSNKAELYFLLFQSVDLSAHIVGLIKNKGINDLFAVSGFKLKALMLANPSVAPLISIKPEEILLEQDKYIAQYSIFPSSIQLYRTDILLLCAGLEKICLGQTKDFSSINYSQNLPEIKDDKSLAKDKKETILDKNILAMGKAIVEFKDRVISHHKANLSDLDKANFWGTELSEFKQWQKKFDKDYTENNGFKDPAKISSLSSPIWKAIRKAILNYNLAFASAVEEKEGNLPEALFTLTNYYVSMRAFSQRIFSSKELSDNDKIKNASRMFYCQLYLLECSIKLKQKSLLDKDDFSLIESAFNLILQTLEKYPDHATKLLPYAPDEEPKAIKLPKGAVPSIANDKNVIGKPLKNIIRSIAKLGSGVPELYARIGLEILRSPQLCRYLNAVEIYQLAMLSSTHAQAVLLYSHLHTQQIYQALEVGGKEQLGETTRILSSEQWQLILTTAFGESQVIAKLKTYQGTTYVDDLLQNYPAFKKSTSVKQFFQEKESEDKQKIASPRLLKETGEKDLDELRVELARLHDELKHRSLNSDSDVSSRQSSASPSSDIPEAPPLDIPDAPPLGDIPDAPPFDSSERVSSHVPPATALISGASLLPGKAPQSSNSGSRMDMLARLSEVKLRKTEAQPKLSQSPSVAADSMSGILDAIRGGGLKLKSSAERKPPERKDLPPKQETDSKTLMHNQIKNGLKLRSINNSPNNVVVAVNGSDHKAQDLSKIPRTDKKPESALTLINFFPQLKIFPHTVMDEEFNKAIAIAQPSANSFYLLVNGLVSLAEKESAIEFHLVYQDVKGIRQQTLLEIKSDDIKELALNTIDMTQIEINKFINKHSELDQCCKVSKSDEFARIGQQKIAAEFKKTVGVQHVKIALLKSKKFLTETLKLSSQQGIRLMRQNQVNSDQLAKVEAASADSKLEGNDSPPAPRISSASGHIQPEENKGKALKSIILQSDQKDEVSGVSIPSPAVSLPRLIPPAPLLVDVPTAPPLIVDQNASVNSQSNQIKKNENIPDAKISEGRQNLLGEICLFKLTKLKKAPPLESSSSSKVGLTGAVANAKKNAGLQAILNRRKDVEGDDSASDSDVNENEFDDENSSRPDVSSPSPAKGPSY